MQHGRTEKSKTHNKPNNKARGKQTIAPKMRDWNETIKNKKTTVLDFYTALPKVSGAEFCAVLHEGVNLLHLSLKHNRPEFMEVLQAVGAWPDIVSHSAETPSDFVGVKPRQYADAKCLRRLLKKMDLLDELEFSMGGRNAVLKFCRSGDLDGLKNAINAGHLRRDPVDFDGNNAVHWACITGNLELVKHVVKELKVNPKKLNNRMENPLRIAVNYGQSQLVDFLVVDCQLDTRQVDIDFSTPTHKAAENGDVRTLNQLHNSGVVFDPNLLVKCAKNGSAKCIKYLLGDCTMDEHTRDTDGKTLLMIAAENGNVELVQYLIDKKDLSLRDVSCQDRNALHCAAENGHVDVTKCLLQKGREQDLLSTILNQRDKHKIDQLFALIRGLDKGRPAWHYVHLQRRYVFLYDKWTKNGRVDASFVGTIAKSNWGDEPDLGVLDSTLEEYKANNRTKDGCDDVTPLLLAASNGQGEVALLLLKAGAGVHVVDCFGQTAMHMAAAWGNLELAVALEKAGVPLNSADYEGFTPHKVARDNEQAEVSNMFCESSLHHVRDFAETKIRALRQELSREKLNELRRSGHDITKHVINAVRDLQIEINILLKELGSGPILEESRRQ